MRTLRGVLIADPCIVLATIFFLSLSLITSFFSKTGNVQAVLAQMWAKVMFAVSGVKVRVEGIEHIDPQGSYVFIANHLSYADTPVVVGHIPVQFRFLAKRSLFRIPLLGGYLGRGGHIPVQREEPRAAFKTMQTAAEAIQKTRISLLVFPEGGRSHDGELRPFKEGGAYIAIRAGVPLVPIVLMGTRDVLPFGGRIVRSGSVTLRILKPIPTSELTLKDRGQATARLRERILNELEIGEPEPQTVR